MHSGPVIGVDATIYAGSNDGNLYAINPDGTEKWRYQASRLDNGSAAVGKDGVVYIGSGDNHFYAIDANGTLKWRFLIEIRDDFDSSTAIAEDGTIYFTSTDGYLYALHSNSGGLAASAWPKLSGDSRSTGRVSQPSQQ